VAESDVFITMADGVRLAATLYLPETEGPWPALLEAYPYRKDDISPDAAEHRRLRDEGDYAVCRLDTRGTGSSEGIASAEYPPEEADDLCQVVAWLAAQNWCTGSVGMYGTSYGGFNTIHTAMRRPPALKAIVPIYATDDRYTDDVHFAGGVRKAMEFAYPLFMVALNALPPVPSLAGGDWHRLWLRRIDELVPWFGQIEEQNDGPFWHQGSLRPDYDLIQVPTMLVGGWADLYRNAMLRMFEHLKVPKRLLTGPWSHMSPSRSIPGPRIDIVREMLRWWDRWLRGVENGVDAEPPLVFFVRRSSPPEPDLDEVRGTWRYEPDWPLARGRDLVLPLADANRARDAEVETLTVRGDVGLTAYIRGTYYPPYGLALDQRRDEAYSLVYDWPVERELEVLGNPVLELAVRSTHPVAFASAKLCEVLADGTSVLVSRGLLNLTHRSSDAEPEPLVPGETYEVRVELDATSWVFEPGSRIRLAIAGSDWPDAWPPPEASELSVVVGDTRLVLPEVPGPAPVAEEPSLVPSLEPVEGATDGTRWRIEHDVYRRETCVVAHQDTVNDLGDGKSARQSDHVRVGVRPASPGEAWVESTTEAEVVFPEVTARAVARLVLRSDATTYALDLDLDVFENGEPIASRNWAAVTPRKLQ
jgi:hypothetical protein